MRISALIPTHNRRKYIFRAIDSVLSQTPPVDEVLVVDDGSTDGTAEAIDSQYGDRVRLIRQPNLGVSGARLRAVREARGEWIAFLDSDDEWAPDRIRVLSEAAMAVPKDVAWVFGDVALVYDSGAVETIFEKFGLRMKSDPHVFMDPLAVQHPFQFGLLQGSLIRRGALLELGAFTSGLRHSEDFLVGVQLACRYRFAAIRPIVTRLNRTSDLRESSLDLAGRGSPDYFRARMAAFSLIIQTGRKDPWGDLYADAVRGLCKSLARQSGSFRLLAFEQFRYRVSGKEVAFTAAALFGKSGMQAWKGLGALLRPFRRKERGSDLGLGWNQ
jgi:glycosyltransferase involved in cell wall biosynthesis